MTATNDLIKELGWYQPITETIKVNDDNLYLRCTYYYFEFHNYILN